MRHVKTLTSTTAAILGIWMTTEGVAEKPMEAANCIMSIGMTTANTLCDLIADGSDAGYDVVDVVASCYCNCDLL